MRWNWRYFSQQELIPKFLFLIHLGVFGTNTNHRIQLCFLIIMHPQVSWILSFSAACMCSINMLNISSGISYFLTWKLSYSWGNIPWENYPIHRENYPIHRVIFLVHRGRAYVLLTYSLFQGNKKKPTNTYFKLLDSCKIKVEVRSTVESFPSCLGRNIIQAFIQLEA